VGQLIEVIDERLAEVDPSGPEAARQIREIRQYVVGLRHALEECEK
jgi:hypothetical protein